ncbi:Mitochondrial porin [Physocladia obscura]|uniref:Mitochondrial porin n=1 Tax=Physocladia obscura TaxID=109957 RepID=A0AAD5XDI1_9FUNG|nr:Mitochondrial porin [Physocladia obscura]
MSVPNYPDFSKDVNDLLNKDYPLNAAKLEVNTTAANGVKVTINNVRETASGKIVTDLKTKYSDKDNGISASVSGLFRSINITSHPVPGLTLTNTWHAANILSAHVELQDVIARGVKVDIHGSVHPTLGTTAAKAGVELKQANVFARSSVDLFAKSGATVHTDVVVGSDGLLLAGDVAYNTADATIHRYNVAVGFKTSEYAIGFHATKKFTHFSASYFHNINSGLQVGSRAIWDQAKSDQVGIELGTKYALERTSFVKAKIDNSGKLGLGYTITLRPSVKLQIGGSFDTSKWYETVHKIGVSVVIDN